MGRGSNRRSLKMKRRISWRKNKARIKQRIAEGKSADRKATASKAPARENPSPVTRRSNEQ